MKPVMYLDVDGVLWDFRYPERGADAGARGVAAFMRFALEHFEVRWLTYWAIDGAMRAEKVRELSGYTGVPEEVWNEVRPSLGFDGCKAEGIGWAEHGAGRPFVWVDDDVGQEDLEVLRAHGAESACFHTDVLSDPGALLGTMARLQDWLERV